MRILERLIHFVRQIVLHNILNICESYLSLGHLYGSMLASTGALEAQMLNQRLLQILPDFLK